MATRRILIALIAVLSVFVCVAGAGVTALGLSQLGARPPSDEGLIVLDEARQMRLLGANGAERVLAQDLTGEPFRYPAPAPDGERVAYIGRDADGYTLISLNLRTGDKKTLYRSADEPPLYLSWSLDSSTISFLINRAGGTLGVQLVPADGSSEATALGASVSSSYFAWQPGGGRLLLHSGGSSTEGGRMAVYEPGSTAPASTLNDPGLFQAPAWSLDGSGFFYVAQPAVNGQLTPDQIESRLTRVPVGGGEPQVIATETQAAMLFSRSPASDEIAYVTAGPAGFGALKVVDAVGGQPRVLSKPDEAVPAFFWSPDGAQLAYLTFEPRAGALPTLTWHVVARDGGATRTLASFTPSQDFASLINFFDAYAISLDLWSPDGSKIVYGASDGVYELPVAGGTPTRRADGTLGLWARR